MVVYMQEHFIHIDVYIGLYVYCIQLCCFSFQVKTILVNIFGGIVNCATVATGIIKASKKLHLELPLVVRLEGKHPSKHGSLPFHEKGCVCQVYGVHGSLQINFEMNLSCRYQKNLS